MKIIKENECKGVKKPITVNIYKVKKYNIDKMLAYLKKEDNESRRN